MAFNPFNIFRRNQRVIFAIVTVFVMFTFVLSSGLAGNADFFSWLPNWIGSKTNKGTSLFEIDGKRYYDRDLQDIRMQRVAANQYMSMAAGVALNNLNNEINNRIGKVSEENRERLEQTQQYIRMMMTAQVPANQVIPLVKEIQRSMKALAGKEGTALADIEMARDLETFATIVGLRVLASQDVYFTNIPYKSNQDIIEFLLWRKKADKVGINFTNQDVQAMVASEFVGKLGSSEVDVRRRVTEDRRIADSRLWEALNDEFRVRLAQNTVLGQEMARPNGPLNPLPTYASPFDLFNTYRDLFSPTTYDMLAIPTANFLDQVKETPTQAELDKLFAEYKGLEPNPSSDKPGFKEPRKAKIEWISATGTEPYYKTGAEQWLKQGELQARIGGLFTVPLGAPGAAWAVNVLPLFERELAIQAPYRAKQAGFDSELNQQYLSGRAFSFALLDTHLLLPGNIASAMGAIGGSLPAGPAGLVGISAFQLNALERERQARLKVSLPLLMGGIVPFANLGTQLVGAFEAVKALPRVPGPEVYKTELLTKMLDNQAQGLMARDFNTFATEVRARTKDIRDARKKKAAVDSYIDEFWRSRGLKQGASTEFRDEYNAGDDPSLAPLKAEASRMPPRGPLPTPFGKAFFYIPAIEAPEMMDRIRSLPREAQQQEYMRLFQSPDVPGTGVYEPREYPARVRDVASEKALPNFLVWRTEEKAPQTVIANVAMPKVLAAWKELKARELAKQEAERIAAEVQSKKATNATQVFQNLHDVEATLRAKFTDDAKKDAVRLFENPGVAPFEIQPDNRGPMAPPQYRPFTMEPNVMIPYPNVEMARKLLDDRKQPTGTTFVVSDASKDTFYVASVAQRSEQTESAFKADVYNAAEMSPVRQLVYSSQSADTMKVQREGALALLKQEFKYQNENTELLKKNRDE